MSKGIKENNVGLLLKELLKEQSLSMRRLSRLTEIDPATISRIINGKRKASPEHLQKFAECLKVPITDFFAAAGFSIELKQELYQSDIHMSVDSIQNLLESSKLYDKKFTIASVEQHLENYEQYTKTEEGRETILNGFEEKLRKVGRIGPFISQLKDMYEKFSLRKGSPKELALIGSALLYFILPVDVIPDYIFPIGYLDDVIAVQIVIKLLLKD
ncbi:helix-turn-helix domain-containing protein [Bacillus xiapuensis]|uniref:Helix-turn-helix domain-containing protein n=1 Tax=Bacillus xiapuensis TaxID=2014075 RepID=A0ABU6N8F4_9BACI|nr:helix-turn-helix domain-containing protein [Bacillus xiapuensis]